MRRLEATGTSSAGNRPRTGFGWFAAGMVLIVAGLLGACGRFQQEEPASATGGLLFVTTESSDPVALHGSVLTNDVTVFIDPSAPLEADAVLYYLNDPERVGPPLHIASEPPYELHLSVVTLSPGQHQLAVLARNGDEDTLLSTPSEFIVAADEEASDGEQGNGGNDDGNDNDGNDGGGNDNDDDGNDNDGNDDGGNDGGDHGGDHGGGNDGGDHGGGNDGDHGGSNDPMPEPRQPPSEHAGFHQIYVSVNGADSADGSAGAPLRTIAEGLSRAVANRSSGRGTRINVLPGVYRESLVGTHNSSPSPTIVIQAVDPGTVTISGADVWTNWNCSGGTCTHHWPYRWGTEPNPWPVHIGELARRREMVIVNGHNLDQHMSLSALTAGSFYVDEANARIHVRPPTGVDLNRALVEVAVRDKLMRLQGLSDFVIRGIRFSHAATPFRGSAVEIVDQSRVVIEDSAFTWNGASGVSFKGRDFTIRNTFMNHNGANGFHGFRIADVLFEDTEASHNNWRGERGNYRTWAVGHKFVSAHRVTFRRHSSVGNYGNGLWLDTDGVRVRIEDSTFCDNYTNGIFVEANQGPITIENSTLCRNGDAGLLTSATHGLTLRDNRFDRNPLGAVRISGDFNRRSTDWETGQTHTLNNRDWVWQGNTMAAAGGALVISTTHNADRFRDLMSNSRFSGNTYLHTTSSDVFQVGGGSRVTFAQWQSQTSQDATSTFRIGSP